MIHRMLVPVLFLVCWSCCPVGAGDVKESKSARETSRAGLVDLLADHGIKEWKRVPIPPGSKLNARNPWSMSSDGKTLICDGVGLHEMLLWDKEVADGVFHAEWRFKKLED